MRATPTSTDGLLRGFVLLLVLSICLGLTSLASARTTGDARFEVQAQDKSITVFTYRPPHCTDPAILFVFHGKGRKASKMRKRARPLADQACFAVFAPLFDKENFPNWRYHRAGVVKKKRLQPKHEWTALVVEDLIHWARSWLGNVEAPFYLFGHSAGGQFLSRISAYSPLIGASRIIVANPSVHVWPSLGENVPYGFGGVFGRHEAVERLEAYLSLPLTIYIGEEDTGEKNLVKKKPAMRQGTHRFERALNAFRAGKELTDNMGWTFNWRLVIAPGIGHSSGKMLKTPEMIDALGITLPALDDAAWLTNSAD